jgi:cytochrome c-type biogenesis protein CcmH
MIFWTIMTMAILIVAFLLLYPLTKGTSIGESPAKAQKAAVHAQQIREIENDFEHGVISESEFATLQVEAQRRLIETLSEDGQPKKRLSKGPKLAALIFFFFSFGFPAAAVAGYMHLGQPGMGDFPLSERTADLQQQKNAGRIASMVAGLAEKLKKAPDDATGWAMLARSYRVLGRVEESKSAYERAHALTPNDTAVALQYAETILFLGHENETQKARYLLEDVLKTEPNNQPARFYLAISLGSDSNETERAISILKTLLSEQPADTESRAIIEKQLQRLETKQ